MKLELKHILPYLLYNLHILIDGLSYKIEGIDLINKEILIAERVNYKLSNVKLILRPFKDWKLIPELYELIDSETEEDFEGQNEQGILDIFNSLPLYVKDLFYKNKIDIFSLIKNNLAVEKNNKEILY